MTENHVTQRTCLEICAGAGGQALGLEAAGFSHQLAVEIDPDACLTLAGNRSEWSVLEADVRDVDGRDFRGIDLLAGGVPCPPFSVAGHQLGSNDERDLFPEALRLVREAKPAAVMLENVRGLAADRFADYRQAIVAELSALGYVTDWRLLQASDFGVPQLRPRFILVALRPRAFRRFNWPWPTKAGRVPTSGRAELTGLPPRLLAVHVSTGAPTSGRLGRAMNGSNSGSTAAV